VAVRLDDTNDSYYFIETTMIGQAPFKDAAKEGNIEWTDAQPHVAAGETDYGWVDVAPSERTASSRSLALERQGISQPGSPGRSAARGRAELEATDRRTPAGRR